MDQYKTGDVIEHRLMPGFPMEVLEAKPCETDFARPEPHQKYRITDPEGNEDWLCHMDVQKPGQGLGVGVAMLDLDDLPAALRAWAKNHDAHVRAAVELLIEHDHWLWDEGFTQRCVSGNDGIACLDFAEMKRYHDEGPPCSESQAAILLVAADIGSGRWRIFTMDGRNRQRVADAVARAAGVITDGT